MIRVVIALIVAMLSAPVYAQTCPVKHPALTALDHESMIAAYTASFRGIFGRNPTLAPGSGADDGNYWVAVSDHYGEFSDQVCRAGWSAYWEQKLTGQDAVSPALGDQPARFQPTLAPPPPPVVIVPPNPPPLVPVPVPVDRDTLVLAAIADLKATMQQEHAEQTRTVGDAAKSFSAWAIKYLVPAIGAYLAGHAMAK